MAIAPSTTAKESKFKALSALSTSMAWHRPGPPSGIKRVSSFIIYYIYRTFWQRYRNSLFLFIAHAV